jgi:hypothetical protein
MRRGRKALKPGQRLTKSANPNSHQPSQTQHGSSTIEPSTLIPRRLSSPPPVAASRQPAGAGKPCGVVSDLRLPTQPSHPAPYCPGLWVAIWHVRHSSLRATPLESLSRRRYPPVADGPDGCLSDLFLSHLSVCLLASVVSPGNAHTTWVILSACYLSKGAFHD